MPITIDVTAAPYLADNTGATNATQAFIDASAALCAAGGGALRIPPGVYTVGRQIRATQSNSGYAYLGEDIITIANCNYPVVIEGSGATLKLASGLKFGSFDAVTESVYTPSSLPFTDTNYAASVGRMLVLSNNTHSVTVRDLELDGNAAGVSLGGEWGESGYDLAGDGVVISSAGDVQLSGMQIHDLPRDGVQLNRASACMEARAPLSLRQVSISKAGRHGLAWLSGNGVTAINCRFNHSGRGALATAPACGVYVNAGTGVASNGRFSNCEMLNNVGVGLWVGEEHVADLTVERSTLVGTTAAPLVVRAPRVHLISSTIAGQLSELYPAQTAGDGDATRFTSCRLTDQYTYADQVFIPANTPLLNLGASCQGVMFDRCKLEAGASVLAQASGVVTLSNSRLYQGVTGTCTLPAIYVGQNEIETPGSVDWTGSERFGAVLLNSVDLPQTAQLGHRQRIFATATRQQNIGFAGSPSSFVSVFGAATVGNIVYNTQPSPGGYVGWVCTVAGNPGTWKPFGAISN